MQNYNKLRRPPKTALREIKGGRLKGKTDISPQWRYEIMTEVYGECGTGWKFKIERTWTDPGANGGVFAFAQISLQVKEDGGWSEPIPGVGGDQMVVKESSGLHNNDEAFKMAVTDALGTAMKMLGVAADIYAGLWDGSKYVDTPKEPAKTPEKDDKAKDPDKWMTGWLKEAKRFKEALGHQAYYEILNNAGSKHANEIKSKGVATTIFNALTMALDDLKEPGNDKEPEKDGTPEEPSTWMTEWLKEAKKLRGLLGDGPYYEILDKHGIPHANDIKDKKKAETIFTELTKALDDK